MRGRDSISGRFAPMRREARASTTGTPFATTPPPSATRQPQASAPPANLQMQACAMKVARKPSAGSRKSKCACGRRGNLRKASYAERRAAAVEQILIARKRPDRKEFPVAVVAQIKHARKTGRREALFIP